MCVSIVSHPLKYIIFNYLSRSYAPADLIKPQSENIPDGASILGIIPHQIRGYLPMFSNMSLTGKAFDKCVACSQSVLGKYKNDSTFIESVCNESDYLLKVTGLDVLMKSIDLDAISEDESCSEMS